LIAPSSARSLHLLMDGMARILLLLVEHHD
jgi:hypothetical protein